MSPLPGPPRLSMIERRPKRKGKSKLKLASSRYGREDVTKGRKPALTFQKKLVVIDYMGPDALRSFGLKETYILMRGLLPEVAVSATEGEVRGVIRNTIKDSEETLSGCLSSDFEYMEASGKCVCIPAHQAGFEWTGRAVKQLAGAGAIYVRLTTEREDDPSSESSDSSELPCDVKIVKVEDPGERYVESVWYL